MAQQLVQHVVQCRVGRIFDVVLQQSTLLFDQVPQRALLIRAATFSVVASKDFANFELDGPTDCFSEIATGSSRAYKQISREFGELSGIAENMTKESSDQERHWRGALTQTTRQEYELCRKQHEIHSCYQRFQCKEKELQEQTSSLTQEMCSLAKEMGTLESGIRGKGRAIAVVSVAGVVLTIATTLSGLYLGRTSGAVGGFLAGVTARKGALSFFTKCKNVLEWKVKLCRQQIEDVDVLRKTLAIEQSSVSNSLRRCARKIDRLECKSEVLGNLLKKFGHELTLTWHTRADTGDIKNQSELLRTQDICMCQEELSRADVQAFMNQVRRLRENMAQVLHIPVEELCVEELERKRRRREAELAERVLGVAVVGFLVLLGRMNG